MSTLAILARNRALLTFALGHFSVDLYNGLLPVLYPLMLLEFDLSKGDVGLVTLAFMVASSLSQPFFGYVADRYGSRFLAPASVVWAALMFALVGLSPSFGFLIAAASLAGIGSGAYHPLGAANASLATGDLQKNTAMSLYTVFGTTGYSLGPLLGAVVFGLFGRQGSVALIPIGIIAATLIARSFVRLGLGLASSRSRGNAPTVSIPWRQIAPVIGVTMLRAWVFLSVVTFIPIWYEELGYNASFYGTLTTLVIAAGAAGTLVGGMLADRIGQRQVLIGSLAAAIPALYLFALTPGPIALLTGILFGFLADASISVTLVMAQRLLPGRVGMASGFILGLGFVTGGIGVPITGAIADRIGIPSAMMVVALLLLGAILCTTLIPPQALQTDSSKPSYRPAKAVAED